MNMRQGSRNGNGWFRSGFFIPGNNPRAYPNPARLIKRVFSPEPGSRAPAQITNPEETQKSVTNPKSQIT